jgi:hypothetical protein
MRYFHSTRGTEKADGRRAEWTRWWSWLHACAEQHVGLLSTLSQHPQRCARALIVNLLPTHHNVSWPLEVDRIPQRRSLTTLIDSQSDCWSAGMQVDAHNVVPVWEASDKKEVGARTLRARLHRHFGAFLVDFPPLPEVSAWPGGRDKLPASPDWPAVIEKAVSAGKDVPEVRTPPFNIVNKKEPCESPCPVRHCRLRPLLVLLQRLLHFPASRTPSRHHTSPLNYA